MEISYELGSPLRQGPRGEPLFPDGRPVWYGLEGEALTAEEAGELLRDIKRRRVAKTILRNGRGRICVSTVFLVIDHAFMEDGPVLWETMVFGGPIDRHEFRWRSLAEARQGHRDVVMVVRLSVERTQAGKARRRAMHKSYKAAWA